MPSNETLFKSNENGQLKSLELQVSFGIKELTQVYVSFSTDIPKQVRL